MKAKDPVAVAQRHEDTSLAEADDVGLAVAGDVGQEPRMLLDPPTPARSRSRRARTAAGRKVPSPLLSAVHTPASPKPTMSALPSPVRSTRKRGVSPPASRRVDAEVGQHELRRLERPVAVAQGHEYKKHVEKDAALARRFQPVFVNEPTVEDTISILRGLKDKYEQHHGVRITDGALVAAATLSHRYISDRFLPDKAIDLVDEAAARLKMQVDSKPEELDSIDREIVRLKIEQEALKKESDPGSKERLKQLEKELSHAGEAVGRPHRALEVREGQAVRRAEAQDRARPAARRARQRAAQRRIPARRRTGLWPHPGA